MNIRGILKAMGCAILLLIAGFFLTGIGDCEAPPQETMVTAAVVTLDAALTVVVEPAIAAQCAEGKWSVQECDLWKKNYPCVKKTVKETLPWAIGKLWPETARKVDESLRTASRAAQ